MQPPYRQSFQPQPPPNTHQFTVQNPTIKPIDNNMVATKKIADFSYALTDNIGLGLTSHVYKGKNDLTGFYCDI